MAAKNRPLSDYYKILGVSENATREEIRDTYRKLQKEYHPDLNPSPDATAKSQEINEAYTALRKTINASTPSAQAENNINSEDFTESNYQSTENYTVQNTTQQETSSKNINGIPVSKGSVGAAASKVASKAVGRSIGSKIAGSAIGKGLGAVLGTIAPLIGNLIGAILGDFIVKSLTKIGRGVGKTIGAAPAMILSAISQFGSLIASSLAQTIGIAFSFTVVSLAILALFLTFVLFIINSGAYIVPPGSLSSLGGGSITVRERVGCYTFQGEWPIQNLEYMTTAARHILARPGAEPVICTAGEITVTYVGDSLTAGGYTASSSSILISSIGSSSQIGALYTLAHETGHIIDARNSNVETLYRDPIHVAGRLADANREAHPYCDQDGILRYLPSYGCFDRDRDGIPERVLNKSDRENKMEAIGLWLMLPRENGVIGYFGGYQAAFPGHYFFANSIF